MIELSVIVPVYNVKEYLENCIYSIVNSAVNGRICPEIILIDDGSTDGSGQIADRLSGQYDFVRVIHQKNRGVAAARNLGIDSAKGRWLFFVDSDDLVAFNSMEIILDAICRHPKADIILFDAWENRGNKQIEWQHFPYEMVWKDSEVQGRKQLNDIRCQILYPKAVPLAAPWDKIYRKEFLQKNGLVFPKELKVLDDMIFNMEAFGRAENVAYKKEKIYHYQRIETSITNSYRPDRVGQDQKVWQYIERYLACLRQKETGDRGQTEALEQSYYCRVIKSFSICCRLCFFHRENTASFGKKLKEVKRVMKEEPYQKAFQRVKVKNLEWRLRLVWMMARGGCATGIGCLHFMNQWMEKHGR